jgi:succinate dehydrogenase / fumarate reductase membrane anchor subunit
MSAGMESSRHGRLSPDGKGTSHWRWQRISALLSIPLSLWLIVSFSDVVYSGYDQSLAWISAPLSGLLLGLTLISLLFHGHLGIVVVIEDYVRGRWRKRAIQISVLLTALTGLSATAAILVLFITK